MYSFASPTVLILSASSSEISIPNSSSRLMMSSTRSSESALRSSTNEASGFTSPSSTPSCSTMIFLSRSYVFPWANNCLLRGSSGPLPRPPTDEVRASVTASHLVCQSVAAEGDRTLLDRGTGIARPPRGAPRPGRLRGPLLAAPDGRGEHAVHELRRGLRAEHLRELDGLVDDHAGRRVAGDAQLVERDAQHVAVDPGHLVDRELRSERRDLGVELLAVRDHAVDDFPGEGAGFVGEARAERAALPGLAGVRAIEVDLEEGLQGEAPRGMPAAARWSRGHAAEATPSTIASISLVATARSATSMAWRIIAARARPWVTTDSPATPRSGAEAYGS